MKTNIYLDCEWFPVNRIFLIGYAYSISNFGTMYGRRLSAANFLKLLKPVDGFVFFYGPDIGVLEKHFSIKLRNNYKCVNLLKVFRRHCPGFKSYRLGMLEKHFGIARSTQKYKANIFQMLRDWKIPVKRQACIRYNEEDVVNLIRVKRKMSAKYGLTQKHFEECRMM